MYRIIHVQSIRLKSGPNFPRARADEQTDVKLQSNNLCFAGCSLYHLESMRRQHFLAPQRRQVDIAIRAALPYNKVKTLIGSQTNYEITT